MEQTGQLIGLPASGRKKKRESMEKVKRGTTREMRDNGVATNLGEEEVFFVEPRFIPSFPSFETQNRKTISISVTGHTGTTSAAMQISSQYFTCAHTRDHRSGGAAVLLPSLALTDLFAVHPFPVSPLICCFFCVPVGLLFSRGCFLSFFSQPLLFLHTPALHTFPFPPPPEPGPLGRERT